MKPMKGHEWLRVLLAVVLVVCVVGVARGGEVDLENCSEIIIKKYQPPIIIDNCCGLNEKMDDILKEIRSITEKKNGGITEKACQKYCLEESGTILDAFTYCMNTCLGLTPFVEETQVGEAVCDHKWRTWWAYAMVCEAPDCPELNPPTMRLRLEWCERCGILRMPEARRKMGREVKE